MARTIRLKKSWVFTDEKSFTSWTQKTKSWSAQGSLNVHALPKKYISVTLYGGIENCLTNPFVIMFEKSTD